MTGVTSCDREIFYHWRKTVLVSVRNVLTFNFIIVTMGRGGVELGRRN